LPDDSVAFGDRRAGIKYCLLVGCVKVLNLRYLLTVHFNHQDIVLLLKLRALG